MYCNRKYYIEYLASVSYYREKKNTLEESLFVILLSTKFTTVTYTMSMILVLISHLIQYLAGKLYEFDKYG